MLKTEINRNYDAFIRGILRVNQESSIEQFREADSDSESQSGVSSFSFSDSGITSSNQLSSRCVNSLPSAQDFQSISLRIPTIAETIRGKQIEM